jgi:hypothetical protein
MLSEAIAGAFVRAGRCIGDGELEEPSEVLFLSVPPWYADLRQLRGDDVHAADLDRSQAFSGSISAERGEVTWGHDLDTTTRYEHGVDRAPVRIEQGDLVEVGEDYLEHWRRIDAGDGLAAVATRHDPERTLVARAVVIGTLALVVGNDGGARLERGASGTWQLKGVVGVAPDRVERLGELLDALQHEGTIGSEWRRAEARDPGRGARR